MISTQFKVILIVALIFTGTFNTVSFKIQNTTKIYERGFPMKHRMFFHPYMQGVSMFIGELFCLLLYFIWKFRFKQSYETQREEAQKAGLNLKINYLMIIIPAFSDFCTSILAHIAMFFMSPSFFLILRSGTVAVTALFSHLVLKREFSRQQKLAFIIVIFGEIFVGVSQYFYQSQNPGDSSKLGFILCIVFVLISLITDSVRYVSEELIMKKYYIHQLHLIGVQGIYGLLCFSIVLPILTFAHCGLPNKDCVFAPNGTKHFERPDQYFYEATEQTLLGVFCLLGVFGVSFFYICGVTVTRRLSSILRAIIEISRTLLVWVIGIIITKSGWRSWEETEWQPILLSFIGYVIVIVGNLSFMKIISWKCLESGSQSQNNLMNGNVDQDHFNIQDQGKDKLLEK